MIAPFIQYLQIEKRFSDHTVQAYKVDLEQFCVFLGYSSIDQICVVRPIEVRSWIVGLFEDGNSKKTINRKLSALRTFFKWLKKEGLVSANPMIRVTGPKNEKRLPSFAKESELEQTKTDSLFKKDFDGIRDRLMFEMFYQTGIRLSELIGLRESDVASDQIRVLGKRNKERLIPVSKDLVSLIENYRRLKRESGLESMAFFVLNNGNKIYPKFVYRKINDYLGNVTSLDKTSPHVLRHTFATHMLNNGAGLETLKDLLGHASLSATQVYTHNSFAQLNRIYSQAHPRGQKN
jgi:integrase/recombinase XerC